MSTVTINAEQKLYVIDMGGGYSTHGFNDVYEQSVMLYSKLKGKIASILKNPAIEIAPPSKEKIGTMEMYECYQSLLNVARLYKGDLGTWYSMHTPPKVKSILEDARLNRKMLRIFYGMTETGCDWMEENDMMGYIGRSTGITKIPLLVKEGDCGGGAILDSCIVRIIDCRTGEEVYRHKNYHLKGKITIGKIEDEKLKNAGYTYSVSVGDECHANFKSIEKAAHWIAYITGESLTEPS